MAKSGSNKKFIPEKKHNLIAIRRDLDKLTRDLEKQKQNIEAISKSNDNHITLLGNFARHDIKNHIQSMDSILSTNSAEELTQEHINALLTNLSGIREAIKNFSDLVPYSQDEKFTIHSLFVALTSLNRGTFYKKKIEFIQNYDKSVDLYLKLPFHGFLQVMNNLIINSINSLLQTESPIIEIKVINQSKKVELYIMDNGERILNEHLEKIFEFGFTTTGGSGIGLFHANFFCTTYKGQICLVPNVQSPYTKGFKISLPLEV